MHFSRSFAPLLVLAALLVAAPGAQAAKTPRRGLHIGYVYPAGGEQGSTFEAIIGGQYIEGVSEIQVSGGGVQAKIVDLIRPITGRELNALRIKLDELMAKRAVVRNDFKALEKFRSFKNAKSLKKEKPDPAKLDKELQELKKKYAGATWTDADEKELLEIRQKMRTAVRRPANPAIGELAVVQFTVAPGAKPGERDLRIGTRTSLSNPLVFCVGSLPEFSAPLNKKITQQKSSIAKTAIAPKGGDDRPEMEITLPAVVNGQILPGRVDRFRFKATKGQRIVVSAAARELIPYIADAVPGWFQATLAIYDQQGKQLAYDDDYRFNPDPVVFCRIPADGEYVVQIKDAIYRGREDFVYRVTIGEVPFITSIFPLGGRAGEKTTVHLQGWNLPVNTVTEDATKLVPGVYPLTVGKGELLSNRLPFAVDTLPECLEKEPNDKPAGAQQVTLPVIVNGRVDHPDDADVFRFEGRAGSEIVAEVYARRLASPLDSVLKLTDASGHQLAINDDHEDKGAGLVTHQADSLLRAKLPADGTYYIRLTDMQHKGGPAYTYRLRISLPQPDFALRIVPATLSARAGAADPVTVYALRRDGFAGPIALSLVNPPEGFRLGGDGVPAGQDQVRLTLTAPRQPLSRPVSLKFEGRATIDGREVVHPGVPADDMMQAFAYQHLVPAKQFDVIVAARTYGGRYSGKRSAVRILGEKLARIPVGGTARVRLQVSSKASLARIKLELSNSPKGIRIKNVTRTTKGIDIFFESDASKVKPGQKGTLIVAAFLKKPPKKKLTTLPAIRYEIVKQ